MASIDPVLAVHFLTQLFEKGGCNQLILWVLGGCSLLGFTVFIERILFLRRSEVDTNRFIISLREPVAEGNIVEAIDLCSRTGGTIAKILKAGLSKNGQGREQIEGAMEVVGLYEIAQLERNAKILSLLAHLAPLIGLLGTVLGFIQAFGEMRQAGWMDLSASKVGEAMEFALMTTAAGLVVAIPTIVAYNYLVSRIEEFVLEIQTTSSELADLLTHTQDNYGF